MIPKELRVALDALEARDERFGGPRKSSQDRPTIPWMRADRARAMAVALRWATTASDLETMVAAVRALEQEASDG